MSKKALVLNGTTKKLNDCFGLLKNEHIRDDGLVDISLVPYNHVRKKVTLTHLKEGENFNKETFNGQTIYIISKDSEGNNILFNSVFSMNRETIANKNKIIK